MRMTEYQKFIAVSRYARWLPKEKRRETWEETVNRYITFFKERNEGIDIPFEDIRSAIVNLEVMPSMRCLMTAGKALERDNVAGYNCAFVIVDDPKVFSEIMYILCNGVGVGFSVEREYVKRLPEISESFYDTDSTIVVRDSKLGWADSIKELVYMLYSGRVPKFDLSRIRPAGARLKTFGGRASGPEPLNIAFQTIIKIFKNREGQKLTSIDCHDIICAIARCVVVGGVRRCLGKNYLINTVSGWKSIQDVSTNDAILFEDRSINITNVINNGSQEVKKINLSDGSYHVCTPEHRWFVFNHNTNEAEWVETNDLRTGKYSMLVPK